MRSSAFPTLPFKNTPNKNHHSIRGDRKLSQNGSNPQFSRYSLASMWIFKTATPERHK